MTVFKTIPVDWLNVFATLVISLIVVAVALWIFKSLWLDKYDFHFPKGRYLIEEVEEENDDSLKATNLSLYMKIMNKLLSDLDPEYWMKYTGFDAFTYIVFQRKMIQAFLTFFVLNIMLYGGLYLILLVGQGHIKNLEKIASSEKYQWLSQCYTCLSITLITTIMISTILSMRRQLQATFYFNHMNSELDLGLNYLKLRTIEIESLGKEFSENSHKLTGIIKSVLRNEGLDSTVNCSIVVPDYHKLLQLEKERAECMTTHKLVAQDRPPLKCLLPTSAYNQTEYQKELRRLDYKIDEALTAETKASRSVLMSLNSFKSITFLKKYFK